MLNFNESFWKNLTSDDPKSRKNQGFCLSPENPFFEKTIGGEEGQIDTPTLFRVNLSPFDNLPAPVE